MLLPLLFNHFTDRSVLTDNFFSKDAPFDIFESFKTLSDLLYKLSTHFWLILVQVTNEVVRFFLLLSVFLFLVLLKSCFCVFVLILADD